MPISMVWTSIPGELYMFHGMYSVWTPAFHELNSFCRTYRDYVNDTGQDVAVQAGPNGPENVRRSSLN